MAEEVIELKKLGKADVPKALSVGGYFDFKSHPFAHEALFKGEKVNSVIAVLGEIEGYARNWLKKNIQDAGKTKKVTVLDEKTSKALSTTGRFRAMIEEGAVFQPGRIKGSASGDVNTVYVSSGANVFGTDIFLDEGDVFIGEATIVEPGVGIKGPAIIGKKNDIRQGAYLRGNCILGDGGTYRGELKNVCMLDKANFPHPSYVGDSVCGYMSHFGNQATAANLGIFEGIRDRDKRKNIVLKIDGKSYDLGRTKVGVILGDFSQVGCNSVADPGTFLRPYTIVYSLTRIQRGFYGPDQIIKNKPLEKGVLEIADFRRE